MTTEFEPIITFKNVTFSDRNVPIIKNISGSFAKGKITTLVGPSGAGKTTLFRLCNGLISPDSGQIIINDKPIDEYDPIILRRKIGLALQSATMLSGSVYKNLSLPLTLKGETLPEDDAKELLEDVSLGKDFLNRNINDLSGGQKQKVSIARTLVNRPKVLLLDEITSSLDRISQHDIEELIQKINQKYGTTIVWITHNLDQALTIGDYSWVMMAGEVLETGKSEFLNNPKDERVKRFIKGDLE
ncbi:phosphate ABC transporter ATP-binding protein [Oceanobacillus caeni]|uniref:Amino acid ABC transporter ATP-binding protein n=1 Tax=Oceanobacillus caeni TaxID=405946 RepID=A0ABR5MJU3_9BACI|nr:MULTISPECIES: phosphate ABC transporter ATP-binding protein [Bacillaceae]KKE79916.1 amino acid ABC transporter ATP-binding protein [Bacilli bacterium VT-13-104]PZD84089.1 phosphate ABC transporter ATP-binding protein [Bacilli bacterium]KPH75211.1 amino acid ABC transporter ATP-binding protein [Oceanobacillus caeni]MCR1835723.1 phosphate ABC transporter ATP-binding protein [Oceanobacillus caeni]MED4475542.1 phosphate ABC transporter ATP-binding protein [Oceanobacillus caeni]